MTAKKGTLGHGSIAVLLACLTAILLTATAPAIGLTWDEPNYIAGADSYAAWFGVLLKEPARAFSYAIIDKYWIVNHEHPPVEKVWSGLIWTLARHVFDDLTANRLGVILLVAFLVALLYLLVAKTFGKAAGLFAVLALLSMPRFFFHAHLAALDVPVAAASFAVIFLFWKTIDRKEWWWGILLGVIWGLAVATKLNGVFIPISLVIWSLIFRRSWGTALRIFLMGISAIAVFFLVWPWLYNKTWDRIMEYVNFHLHHYQIGQWFIGKFYLPPPWTFVLVILAVVVPLSTLILVLVGMVRAGKGKKDRGLVWLLIISGLVSISPFLLGKSLLYDNDRLFMPVYPFLAALAGIGFGWIKDLLTRQFEKVNRLRLATPAILLFGMILLAPQSVIMSRLYPHLLSYYSETVGGLRGATRLGFETTYWCETFSAAFPYINAHARPGDSVWAEPWSFDVLLYYQSIGKLRPDLSILNVAPTQSVLGIRDLQPVSGNIFSADWIIFQYRQSQYGSLGEDYLPRQILKGRKPVYELSYQGIPLMDLYTRIK
jgi:4-amino-4-deoxy-L-arabinose transferase-like glycosyltransferase